MIFIYTNVARNRNEIQLTHYTFSETKKPAIITF